MNYGIVAARTTVIVMGFATRVNRQAHEAIIGVAAAPREERIIVAITIIALVTVIFLVQSIVEATITLPNKGA